jgi:transcriptional regulator PpsR
MSGSAQFPPDITLSVDGDGVIRSAVSAETLSDESLDQWQGLRWAETISTGEANSVANAVESAGREGESTCFVVSQRLPSGRELQLEYTTVKLREGGGFIAIGKSVQAISDLKSRLSIVQKERERDYWKLRDIETRYRALLDASWEGVVIVRVGNLRVVEANAVATKALGLVPGAAFLPDLPDRDRKMLDGTLETARLKGRAPSIVLHLLDDQRLGLRASMLSSEAGTFYLFQLSGLADAPTAAESSGADAAPFALETLVLRLQEGFVVLDREGVVRLANQTFLDLVQARAPGAVVGKDVWRWLFPSGAHVRRILDLVERRGGVRSLRTTLMGELGDNSEVEVSITGDQDDRPGYFALVVRELAAPTRAPMVEPVQSSRADDALETPLGAAVRSSVETVERRRLADALAKSSGNRTLAAESLGISRQTLHAKLRKYGV